MMVKKIERQETLFAFKFHLVGGLALKLQIFRRSYISQHFVHSYQNNTAIQAISIKHLALWSLFYKLNYKMAKKKKYGLGIWLRWESIFV